MTNGTDMDDIPSSAADTEDEAGDARQPLEGTATRRAYAADWAHFASWCRRNGHPPLPADPERVSRYLLDAAEGGGARALSLSTLERRIAGLSWNYAQRGDALDRGDRRLREAMSSIRNALSGAKAQKTPVKTGDVLLMAETLGHDLRGLRDRAILLLGSAAALRRSEIVGLDCGPGQTGDGIGWIEMSSGGLSVTVRDSKRCQREIAVARGAADRSCPVAAVEQWLRLARIQSGPLFRRVFNDGKTVEVARLADKHIPRLVKRTAIAAGLGGDVSEGERVLAFAAHSLRAGATRR